MTKPVIVLVGRPNVGKSTLFNRLIGERLAIIDDIPGTTRDRLVAEGDWSGHDFFVVDTGGIDPTRQRSQEPLSIGSAAFITDIRAQAEIAMETADVILLLVDAQQGVTEADREIVQMLRRRQTIVDGQNHPPIILAVNKADSEAYRVNALDFYSLGLGEPFPISAIHGTGTGDLLDEVIAHFPHPEENEEEDTSIKVAIVGKPNAGKSSLLNKLAGETRSIVSPIPGTTRDAIDTPLRFHGRDLVLIDTAGIRREGKLREAAEHHSLARTRASVKRCDVAFMMIDALDGVAAQEERLARTILDEGRGCVLGVNKWDLVRDADMRRYRERLWERMRFFDHVPVVFLSAKSGRGVERSLDALFLVREQTGKRIATPILNRLLRRAWERTPPASLKGKRCRLYYAAQTGVRPPAFSLFVNNRDLVEGRYANYLSNSLRRAFGFEGAPLRLKFRNRRG